MNRLVVTFLLGLSSGLVAWSGVNTSPSYVNNGIVNAVTGVPQIDATSFINNGSFSVFSSIPYDTLNTLTFTNNGLISGSNFRFDHVFDSGDREPAERFFNGPNATITTEDTFGFLGFVTGIFSFIPSRSSVEIIADQIINRGLIEAGLNGRVSLNGDKVDLRGGNLLVQPTGIFCSDYFLTTSNFFPEAGIKDLYWGIGFQQMDLGSLFPTQPPPTVVITPPHPVTNDVFNFPGFVSLTDANSWVHIDSPTQTNIVIQAVFIQNQDTNLMIDVGWIDNQYPSGIPPTNTFLSALVQMHGLDIDVLTGLERTNSLYILDQLGTTTNITVLTNLDIGTFRPSPIIVSHAPPCEILFPGGIIESNDVFRPALFRGLNFSNQVVTNLYSAYSTSIDFLSSRPANVPGASLTNSPGRIDIKAGSLDMRRTKVRGQGVVTLQADHFVGSEGAAIDTVNYFVSLGSTNQNGGLVIEDLVQDSVNRLTGEISIWSGVWTNLATFPPSTNVLEFIYHVTVIDADSMVTSVPVTIQDLHLKKNNEPSLITLNDNIFASQTLLVETDDLEINGNFRLGQNLKWDSQAFPRLQNLTNSGQVQIIQEAFVGSDRSTPYESFVNQGRFAAFSHLYDTELFINKGEIVSEQLFFSLFSTNLFGPTNAFFSNFSVPSPGPIQVNTEVGILDGGSMNTEGDITLNADVLKLNRSQLSAKGTISLAVKSAFQETGNAASNLWQSASGFFLTEKPEKGDLLGTTLSMTPRVGGFLNLIWAGQDRGTSVEGYVNNAAVGRFSFGPSQDALYIFGGLPGQNNAIYVDLLEISDSLIAELDSSLFVDDGMKIYFADVVSPDSSRKVLAQDFLPGGRFHIENLVWVSEYIGSQSSVDVLLPGNRFVKMNGGMRKSDQFDSDLDGIANIFDEFPLTPDFGLNLSVTQDAGAGSPLLHFVLPPISQVVLEGTNDLLNGPWEEIQRYENSSFTASSVEFQTGTTSSGTSTYGFYRAHYVQSE